MKYTFFILVLSFFSVYTLAQEDTISNDFIDVKMDDEPVKEVDAAPQIFTITEVMPEFPGGMQAFYDYLGRNIKYPTKAKKNNIQGKVYIKFVVRDDGRITDVEAVRGIGGGCDEEAMRVVKSMPNWKPAQQRGENVNMYFTLPINFNL